MRMEHFFDTYAIIEITQQNPGYTAFEDEAIVTTAVNLAEAHYILTQKVGEAAADEIIDTLDVSLLELTKAVAVSASKFRHRHRKQKLSYADCLGYVIARKYGLKFLTGDDAFESMEGVEFVK